MRDWPLAGTTNRTGTSLHLGWNVRCNLYWSRRRLVQRLVLWQINGLLLRKDVLLPGGFRHDIIAPKHEIHPHERFQATINPCSGPSLPETWKLLQRPRRPYSTRLA